MLVGRLAPDSAPDASRAVVNISFHGHAHSLRFRLAYVITPQSMHFPPTQHVRFSWPKLTEIIICICSLPTSYLYCVWLAMYIARRLVDAMTHQANGWKADLALACEPG